MKKKLLVMLIVLFSTLPLLCMEHPDINEPAFKKRCASLSELLISAGRNSAR